MGGSGVESIAQGWRAVSVATRVAKDYVTAVRDKCRGCLANIYVYTYLIFQILGCFDILETKQNQTPFFLGSHGPTLV